MTQVADSPLFDQAHASIASEDGKSSARPQRSVGERPLSHGGGNQGIGLRSEAGLAGAPFPPTLKLFS